MGRPSKYTPETVAVILEALGKGATHELACQAGGISHQTFAEWMRLYPEFLDGIKRVEAKTAQRWLDHIEAAAPKEWQAAAWLLERRYHQAYSRRTIDKAVQVQLTADDLSKMTDEQLDELIRRFDPSAR
jgi:hypothetical protein